MMGHTGKSAVNHGPALISVCLRARVDQTSCDVVSFLFFFEKKKKKTKQKKKKKNKNKKKCLVSFFIPRFLFCRPDYRLRTNDFSKPLTISTTFHTGFPGDPPPYPYH